MYMDVRVIHRRYRAMKDLNSIFIDAKKKKTFRDDFEMENLINIILQSNNNIYLDWDKDTGENWIRLFQHSNVIICMLHRIIGVTFVRLSETYDLMKEELRSIYVVETEDYDLEEWYIDLNILRECNPEIDWHASSNAVDVGKMSLNDLYFATI